MTTKTQKGKFKQWRSAIPSISTKITTLYVHCKYKWLAHATKQSWTPCHIHSLVLLFSKPWDFGGQDVFYSTHQTFLTYRAIYMLVLDGSRTLDELCSFEQYLPGKSGAKTQRGNIFLIHMMWYLIHVEYMGRKENSINTDVKETHLKQLKMALVSALCSIIWKFFSMFRHYRIATNKIYVNDLHTLRNSPEIQ
jgi:hypothetical protein